MADLHQSAGDRGLRYQANVPPIFHIVGGENFDGIIEPSFDEFLGLLLKIFVLIGSPKPRLSHNNYEEMASREEGK